MRLRSLTRFRMLPHGSAAAVVVACVAGIFSTGVAQEKQPQKPAEETEKVERAEFLDDAKHYAIRVTQPGAKLKLHESPVLNFTNPERNQERGSVFVWLTAEGRPAVMGQFFRHDSRRGRLKKHALHSLLSESLEAKFHDKIAWTPEQPGIEWKSFPDAPAVGETERERRLQMKQLVQPFQVKLFEGKDKTTDLRLAPQPLFTYSAPKVGVTEGAIFSYLVATDPEAILLVEAFEENKKTGFRYAFARFHFLRLTATLGDKMVWEAEADRSMIENPIATPATMKKVYNSFLP